MRTFCSKKRASLLSINRGSRAGLGASMFSSVSEESKEFQFVQTEKFYKSFLNNCKLEFRKQQETRSTLPVWVQTGRLASPPPNLTESQVRAFKYIKKKVELEEVFDLSIFSFPGHGKSFLVNQVICPFLKSKGIKYGIIAKTGQAALGIEGAKTFNSYFGLGRYSPEDLRGFVHADITPTVRLNCLGTKVLFFEEISMFNTHEFKFAIERLQFINKCSVSTIRIGDFHQLNIFRGISLIEDLDNISSDFDREGAERFQSSPVIFLHENIRQKSDPQFQKVIKEIIEKTVSEETFNLLNSRHESNLSKEEVERFKSESIQVFPTNKQVHEHHLNKLKSWHKPTVEIYPHCWKISNVAKGRPPLLIAEGIKVYLTRNYWPEQRLVSGSRGVVRKIFFKKNHTFPSIIFVEFENYKGPTVEHGCIPVFPEPTYEFDKELGRKVPVWTFGLREGEASTLHRVQSLTCYSGITLHLERELFLSFLLTGATRAESLSKLMITGNFTFQYFSDYKFYEGFETFKRQFKKLVDKEVKEVEE